MFDRMGKWANELRGRVKKYKERHMRPFHGSGDGDGLLPDHRTSVGTDRQMNENVLKFDEMNVGPSSLMWCSIASSMSA